MGAVDLVPMHVCGPTILQFDDQQMGSSQWRSLSFTWLVIWCTRLDTYYDLGLKILDFDSI